MYRFIQFMSSDGATFGDTPGREYELNPFEVDVLERLTAAGLPNNRLDSMNQVLRDLEAFWGEQMGAGGLSVANG